MKEPKRHPLWVTILSSLVLLVSVWYLGKNAMEALGDRSEVAATAAKAETVALPKEMTWQKIEVQTFGCSDWNDFTRGMILALQGDSEAAARFLVVHNCYHFEKGTPVFVEIASSSSGPNGALKVRPKGVPEGYWIDGKTKLKAAP